MKTQNTVLSSRERDILILCAENPNCRHLSNARIAQRLGISESNLKATIHRIAVKLGANSRNEAIMTALKKGEIGLSDLCSSLDEVAERFKSLGPYVLRRIAHIVRQGLEYEHFLENYEQNTPMYKRHDAILTQAERDVLILVGYGFTNREIADRLCISISSVRTFLYRAYTKLGVRRRADAVILAVKQGEIDARDLFSPADLLCMFTPLGAEAIEEVAHIVQQKMGRELTPVGS